MVKRYSSSCETHLRATERHLPYGITQCYLPPNTDERTPHHNPSHTGRYYVVAFLSVAFNDILNK